MSSGNTHQEVRIEVKGKLDDPLQKIKGESLPLLPDTLLSAIFINHIERHNKNSTLQMLFLL